MTGVFLFLLVCFCSGVAGRLGGSSKDGSWYDFAKNTNTRDIGCAVCRLLKVLLLVGIGPWWAFLACGVLTFLSYRSYYDRIAIPLDIDWLPTAKGDDKHWLAGLLCGVALFPCLWISPMFLWITPVFAVFLALVWHGMEKIPNYVLGWRRDVLAEFIRYGLS